jgi:protein gp37
LEETPNGFRELMSDLFHENVPFAFIERVFNVMQRASWHQFQVLTKRSERLLEFARKLPWPQYVWMGVSVENEDYTWRIDHLRQTPAKIKFLSLEPLLGPLTSLSLENIHWVIVGGESGREARPIEASWVIGIRHQCRAAGVPFFFKQWGGVNKKRMGREIEGRTWDEMSFPPSNNARLQGALFDI